MKLRIVFDNEIKIIGTIMEDTPETGTTYTPYGLIVCTDEEAINFFTAAGYDQTEIDKITAFVNDPTTNPATIETIPLQ